MTETDRDIEGLAPDELRAALADTEDELDALSARRSGFDFRREIRRMRAIGRALVGGEADPDYESEALSGRDLVERIQELQRRRKRLKDRLESLD